MDHSRKQLGGKYVRAFFAAVVIAGAGLTLPAVASADSENIRNETREAIETAGEATGTGAMTGPAIVNNIDAVPQINVQVVAGDEETRENSTQSATNMLNLDQAGTAEAGDASSEDGTASTGPATATNLAVGYQLNVQVIAGTGCEVDQVTSNSADISQEAGAQTGDANATSDGNASSGGASALNVAQVAQRNVQVYVCRDGATGEQLAENVGGFDQTSAAASGSSTADGGSASSGAARARDLLSSDQSNWQITTE